MATLVNVLNPELIVLGGDAAKAGDLLLAAIRETVYRRSLPLATRELRIARSELDTHADIIGGAHMVIDEIFTPARLSHWLELGSTMGHPDLVGTPG